MHHAELIRDQGATEDFSVNRAIFSDRELFDLEMRHIFEGGWMFIGLDNQIPNPNDYFLTKIGRHSILVTRDAKGVVHAFFNTCPHRGAAICSTRQGNSKLHVCPYHSWSFDSAGRIKSIKAKSQGAYSENFLAQNHDLIPIARLDDYRGMLFGSLTPPEQTLAEYLGEATKAIDLVLDQSETGIELLPGEVRYTFRANWKHQIENSSDHYHVTSVHPDYLAISRKRSRANAASQSGLEGVWERGGAVLEEDVTDTLQGSFGFENGHVLSWIGTPVAPGHALFSQREDLARRVGETRRDWMFHMRNLNLFPNVQIVENFASQLRIIRPISPDLTEMVSYCIAPRGESSADRRQRLRQFEDFFNPSGLASPDDMAVYESCQDGHSIGWDKGWLQGYSRGTEMPEGTAAHLLDDLGWKATAAIAGSTQLSEELGFRNYYNAWRDRLAAGQARAAAGANSDA